MKPIYVLFCVFITLQAFADNGKVDKYTRNTQLDQKLKASSTVVSLVFNDDDSLLARGTNDQLAIFRTADGGLSSQLKEDTTSLLGFPQMLVVARGEYAGADIELYQQWDLSKSMGTITPYYGGRNGIASSWSGEMAWTGPKGALFVFSLAKNKFKHQGLEKHERPAYGVAYDSTAKYILTASPDKMALVWDNVSGESQLLFTAKNPLIDVSIPNSPAHYGSQIAAFGDNRGEITIVNFVTRKILKTLTIPDGGISDLLFHPELANILLVAGTTHLYFIDINTGSVVQELNTDDEIFALALSHNLKTIATGHASGTVQLWQSVDK